MHISQYFFPLCLAGIVLTAGCAQKPQQTTGLRHGHVIPANYVTGSPRRIIMHQGRHISSGPELKVRPFLRPLQPYTGTAGKPYGYYPELPSPLYSR